MVSASKAQARCLEICDKTTKIGDRISGAPT